MKIIYSFDKFATTQRYREVYNNDGIRIFYKYSEFFFNTKRSISNRSRIVNIRSTRTCVFGVLRG